MNDRRRGRERGKDLSPGGSGFAYIGVSCRDPRRESCWNVIKAAAIAITRQRGSTLRFISGTFRWSDVNTENDRKSGRGDYFCFVANLRRKVCLTGEYREFWWQDGDNSCPPVLGRDSSDLNKASFRVA